MDTLNIKLARMRAALREDVDINTTYGISNVKTDNIRFINSVNGEMEIDIFGDIGDVLFEDDTKGYTFVKFKEDLTQLEGDTIVINIKSRGGDAYEALAIYDELRKLDKTIITNIVGTTASAGTIIALAGDIRTISPNSKYLIHKGRINAFANAVEMKDIAEGLEAFDNKLINLYSGVSGLSLEEINTLMDQDKFIDAEEAVRLNFCTDIMSNETINKINNFKQTNIMKAKFAKILNVEEDKVEETLETTLSEKEALAAQITELTEQLAAKDEEIKNTTEALTNLQNQLDEIKAKEEEAKRLEEEAKEEEEVMNIINAAVESNKINKEAVDTWKTSFKTLGKEAVVNMISSIPENKKVTNFKEELDTTPKFTDKASVINAWKKGEINTSTYQKLVKSFQ